MMMASRPHDPTPDGALFLALGFAVFAIAALLGRSQSAVARLLVAASLCMLLLCVFQPWSARFEGASSVASAIGLGLAAILLIFQQQPNEPAPSSAAAQQQEATSADAPPNQQQAAASNKPPTPPSVQHAAQPSLAGRVLHADHVLQGVDRHTGGVSAVPAPVPVMAAVAQGQQSLPFQAPVLAMAVGQAPVLAIAVKHRQQGPTHGTQPVVAQGQHSLPCGAQPVPSHGQQGLAFESQPVLAQGRRSLSSEVHPEMLVPGLLVPQAPTHVQEHSQAPAHAQEHGQAPAHGQTQRSPAQALPEAVFSQLLAALPQSDVRSVRLVCCDWRALTSSSLATLTPYQLKPQELAAAFPNLMQLDLSKCMHGLRASHLRILLRQLVHLSTLQLGCPEGSYGSACVSDRCLLEVAQSRVPLRDINTAQCVHLGDSGLLALANVASLRRINLSGCVSITDVGVLMLTQLPALQHLDLSWCIKLSNAGLKALTAAQNSLTSLNISGCPLVTEPGLAHLGSLTRLSHLDLCHMGLAQPVITDGVIKAWADLTGLTRLGLGGMQVGSADVTDSSLLLLPSHHPLLSSLELHCLHLITDACVQLVAAALAPQLTRLVLRNCTKVSHACLPALALISGLHELELMGCGPHQFDVHSVAALMGVEKGPAAARIGAASNAATPQPNSTVGPHQPHQIVAAAGASTSVMTATPTHSLAHPDPSPPTLNPASSHRPSASDRPDPSPTHPAPGPAYRAYPTPGRPSTVPTPPPFLQLRSLSLGGGPLGAAAAAAAAAERLEGLDDGCLALLAPLGPSLRALVMVTFTGTLATPSAWHGLAGLSGLTQLELMRCQRVSQQGLLQLSAAPCASHLQHLSLGSLDPDASCSGMGALLAACTWLTALSLRGAVDDSVMQVMGRRLPRLTSLQLHEAGGVTDTGLAALGPLRALSGLVLSCCDLVTGAGLGALRAEHHHSGTGAGTHRGGAQQGELPAGTGAGTNRGGTAEAHGHGPVASDAGRGGAGDTDVPGTSHRHVAPGQMLHKGVAADIHRGRAPDTGRPGAADGGAATSTVRGAAVAGASGRGGKAVVVRQPRLLSLSLSGCTRVDDQGLRAVCGAAPSLTRLDLCQCAAVTDDGVAALAALTLLTMLDLQQCSRITDVSLHSLARLSHLATLRLNGCVCVTDSGLAALCPLSTVLLTLQLDKCVRVTDAGVSSLARVTSLTSLRLARCPRLTDAGVAALVRLTRLSTLSLAHCSGVTAAGLMALAPLTALASLNW